MSIEHYGEKYAQQYIEHTLNSPYTKYKNIKIAQAAHSLRADSLVDLGCNVSGLIRRPGSLRFQTDLHQIGYIGLDLSASFFDTELPHTLGVSTKEIYQERKGLVGDINNLPFQDNSIKLAVSADVIEHIPNPQKALSEIYRSLCENGNLIIVVPSMYKLDAVKYPHIINTRASSHENRLDADEWKNMFSAAGFQIDEERSSPIGIASGLSYLSWLDDRYVPTRPDIDSKEVYSPEAYVHKKAKQVISDLDSVYDSFAANNPSRINNTVYRLLQGDIKGSLYLLGEELLSNNQYLLNREERRTLETFFNATSSLVIEDERTSVLVSALNNLSNPTTFLGNSSLLVLKK